MCLTLLLNRPAIHYDLPPFTFLALWLAGLGFFVLLFWATSRQRRQRTQAMQQLALEIGCAFTEKPDSALATQVAGIQTSTDGLSPARRFSNILQGSYHGGDFVIADCTTGGGKNSVTFTLVAYQFKDPLPHFTICPEHKLLQFLEKLGLSEIDIPEAPEFSRRYFLRAADESAIRQLFTAPITSAFEMCTDKSMYVTSSGNWLTFYYPRGIIEAGKLRDFRQQVEPIAEAFFRSSQRAASL